MTRARTAVLRVLESAAEPLSALCVAAKTEGLCDQATVYRSLHYLETQGFAESFVLHCSEHGTERYYAASAHRHWFHCESCHRFIDLGSCSLGGILERVESAYGVTVRQHVMYLTGICAECR